MRENGYIFNPQINNYVREDELTETEKINIINTENTENINTVQLNVDSTESNNCNKSYIHDKPSGRTYKAI